MSYCLEVLFQVKNSKSFSTESWLEDGFLSATQLATCRALFREQASRLELVVIDLTLLDPEPGGQGQALASLYLHQAEQERLAAFRFAKRRLEWLGGRIAAKKAAMPLLAGMSGSSPDICALRVEADPPGRPGLCWPATKEISLPELSISHSGRYAGGLAVMGQSCGLDLQKITPRVIRVRDHFAIKAELAAISISQPALGEAAALSLIWSAKEAFRKAFPCHPLLGFRELTLLHVAGDAQGGMIGYVSCPRLTTEQLVVFLASSGDFACAITVQPNHRPWL